VVQTFDPPGVNLEWPNVNVKRFRRSWADEWIMSAQESSGAHHWLDSAYLLLLNTLAPVSQQCEAEPTQSESGETGDP
jgi:hypothetical protein